MKKIFQIASYDFKRLLMNPITMIIMIIVLAVTFATSLIYDIPTTPAYSIAVDGDSTQEVYSNFINLTSANFDTKNSSKEFLKEAEQLLETQSDCQDYAILQDINNSFKEIEKEILEYQNGIDNTYVTERNIDGIKAQATRLKNFVDKYEASKAFESTIFFKISTFKELKELSNFFTESAQKQQTVLEAMELFSENISKFSALDDIISEKTISWKIGAQKLEALQTNHITKAENRLAGIEAEMSRLNSASPAGDTSELNNMTSLAASYKLTCESAKVAVEKELELVLIHHFGDTQDFLHYTQVSAEMSQLTLTKASYFLNSNELYYTQSQEALNFNTASYQVSVYDNTYFIASIIGFLNILFGIFCAYKLFGRDRKNGKMDVILSQNVTFGQVFAGKFFAIVLTTSFMLALYTLLALFGSMLLYPQLGGSILAVFNLNSVYTIHPFLFLTIKLIGIELQVIFYAMLTIFLMNVSRKFELFFGIAVAIFLAATICNIFLNGSLVYCLFPFIHADLTSFLGGGTMNTGFLVTSLYAHGNFFISLAYYLVVVVLLYNFTNQLFKKN
ncbi:MAG: hypothetical protein J6K39_01845 [Clostridia bacterium]|nr:hypothetical protein [Clostridia bacterium]